MQGPSAFIINLEKQVINKKLQQIRNIIPYYELIKQRLKRTYAIIQQQKQSKLVFQQEQPFKLTLSYAPSIHLNIQKLSSQNISKPQTKKQTNQSSEELQKQSKKQEVDATQKQKNKQQTISKEKPTSFPNIFVYSYTLPTTIQQYEKITRSVQLQQKFDQNLNQYTILKEFQTHDLQVIHLTYKRVLLIAPRQFVYFRWFLRQKNMCWIITVSIPYQLQSTKIRADIIMTVTQIQQKSNQIYLKVFSQVDMKAIVKADMAKSKGSYQIKKFIQKVYKHLATKK